MRCRVLINGRFLLMPISGVQRYGREMISALLQRSDPRFEFVLALPRSIDPSLFEGVSTIRGGGFLPGILWQQLWLPPIFRRAGCDILWSPCNIGPVRLGRHVVTIHDASPFACGEYFSPHFRSYYRWAWRELGRHTIRIVTNSAFSRDELVRHGVAGPDKISVVPAGVSSRFRHVSAGGGTRGYVLTVGSRDPRKNIRRLLEAWELIPAEVRQGRELLIAGGAYGCFSPEGLKVPSGGDVRFLGFVGEGDLPALYSGADVFVYPSLYEGFGLPPLEAMACGCPVVASRAGPLPGVCGPAAVYVDPLKPESIAGGIARVMQDGRLRDVLVAAGHRQAARFTWDRSAEKLLGVLDEVWREVREGG